MRRFSRIKWAHTTMTQVTIALICNHKNRNLSEKKTCDLDRLTR